MPVQRETSRPPGSIAGGQAARDRKPVRQVKLVVTGPLEAGRTTLIKTISEIAVLSTERRVSDRPGDGHAPSLRGQTTVAMDFGRLTISPDLVLFLFGTPGQRRFDFMWEILSDGMLGFIILVDAARETGYPETASILGFFREVAAVPYIVAVNKGSEESDGGVSRARSLLQLPADVRCVAVDATDRESVKATLLELLFAVRDATVEPTAATTTSAARATANTNPTGPEIPSARAQAPARASEREALPVRVS